MNYVTTALHCHVNVYRWTLMMTAKNWLAETLKISHETTKHVYNNMCRQNMTQ